MRGLSKFEYANTGGLVRMVMRCSRICWCSLSHSTGVCEGSWAPFVFPLGGLGGGEMDFTWSNSYSGLAMHKNMHICPAHEPEQSSDISYCLWSFIFQCPHCFKILRVYPHPVCRQQPSNMPDLLPEQPSLSLWRCRS